MDNQFPEDMVTVTFCACSDFVLVGNFVTLGSSGFEAISKWQALRFRGLRVCLTPPDPVTCNETQFQNFFFFL